MDAPGDAVAVDEGAPGIDSADIQPAWAADGAEDGPSAGMETDSSHVDAKPDEAATGVDAADANDLPGRSWFAPAPQDTSGPVSDDMIHALGGVEAVEAASGEPGASSAESVPPPEMPVSTTYTWNPDDHQIEAVREPVAPPAVTPTAVAPEASGPSTADAAGDPLVEARSLAARLTEVLATVPAGGTGQPSLAAVASSIADEADVEALRSVVASAQERPRDVDVMLDLVLRAETIAAVLADRDLLLAAVRGEGPASTAAPSRDGGELSNADDEVSGSDDEPSTYPAWRELP